MNANVRSVLTMARGIHDSARQEVARLRREVAELNVALQTCFTGDRVSSPRAMHERLLEIDRVVTETIGRAD
jgi:hypothetical protein